MIAFKSENPFGYGRVINNKQYITSVIEEINTDINQKKIKLCNSGVMLCDANLLFRNINKITNDNIKKERYLPDIFSIFYRFFANLGIPSEPKQFKTIKKITKHLKNMSPKRPPNPQKSHLEPQGAFFDDVYGF